MHDTQTIYSTDVAVYATSKLADLLPHIIRDFPWGSATAYDPRYLAGWPAEIYEASMAEASLNARKQVVDGVLASIYGREPALRDLGYSTSNISILSFKLVLAPFWVTEYQSQGRTLRVIINGKSGSVYGETPSRGILAWLENALDG